MGGTSNIATSSHEVAKALSLGRQPQVVATITEESPEGAKAFPGADALG